MTSIEADNRVIEIDRFSYSFGAKKVLRDVSFTVRHGEYVSIVGPNGAGKTTLIKCLDRIYRGGTGRIDVIGRPVESYRQKDLARLVSYVPQADGRVFPFTVSQFVLMGRYPYLNPFSTVSLQDRRAVGDALERTGTAAFGERPLDTLSGGERQKVYIAAALAQGAEILLLDEPTTFLDYHHQAEIRDLLAEVNRKSGVTILAVTHDVNRAALDSHRVVALRDGAVVFHGPSRQVMDPHVLKEIYDTPFLLVDHPGAGIPVVVPQVPSEGGE